MRRWSTTKAVALAAILAGTITGCTLSQGEPSGGEGGDSAPRVVTATLSRELDAVVETIEAPEVEAGPSVTPSPAVVTGLPSATAPLVPTDFPTELPTATAPATATITPIPTQVGPPTITPLPTQSPTPVPTRTLPGPTAVAPLDDGSGNLIAGTGNETVLSPVVGVDALPDTLYYLSDVGAVAQVFRLRIGLNHPDQLTFSGNGVQAYSVAADGTLAYITPDGNLTVGGIPFFAPQSASGTPAQVTALAWSPAGDWLAYVLAVPGAADSETGVSSTDGVWMRNREGTTVQLAANNYSSGADRRVYSGPLRWRAGGGELLVRTMIDQGTPSTRLSITDSTITPLWNDTALPPDSYTDARWNVNDNAIITSGGRRVLRVEPGTLNGSVLLDESAGLTVESADQWADGTVTFAGRAGDGTVRLYVLPPGTQTPQAVTDVLTTGGRVEFLWGDLGREVLLAIYEESAGQNLGTGYWRTADGAQRDLSTLIGAVGAPEWGTTFQRNDWARITTNDGEALNIRSAPSLQSQVLIQLVTGSRVAIIGGPRVADGYRWWQVRASDGAAGWAVESVLDDRGLQFRTLVPVD